MSHVNATLRTCDRLALRALIVLSFASVARADEGGVSFWQPGTYGSLAAVPNSSGWALSTTSFHGSGFAGAGVTASRLVRVGAINENQAGRLAGKSDNPTNTMSISPSYTFSETMLGAQVSFGLSTLVGKASVYDHGSFSAVAGGRLADVQFGLGELSTGFGDVQPLLALFWSAGEHHFMTYGTSNLPVGNYRSVSLANLGIGFGALDAGAGYTYLNQKAGVEFSAVAGLTYNFLNPVTNYKNGVDFHLETGASKYLTDALFVGPVAYFYRQVGCDSGGGDSFGCYRSQVAGAGAQIGYSTAAERVQLYFNLSGYGEFASENRPAGWNVRLNVALSPK